MKRDDVSWLLSEVERLRAEILVFRALAPEVGQINKTATHYAVWNGDAWLPVYDGDKPWRHEEFEEERSSVEGNNWVKWIKPQPLDFGDELAELRAFVVEEATYGCCACPDDADGRTQHKEWCRWKQAKVLVEKYMLYEPLKRGGAV